MCKHCDGKCAGCKGILRTNLEYADQCKFLPDVDYDANGNSIEYDDYDEDPC